MTFTVKYVSEHFAVSEQTVLGWIHSRQLRAVNVARRLDSRKPRWRISEEALAAFEQLRSATSPRPRIRRRKRPDEVIEFYK